MFDVAIIGAGIAGLTCAQRLKQSGCTVVVLEKSRGFGGRLATRRVEISQGETPVHLRIDHGARYLEPRGKLTQQLIQHLGVKETAADSEQVLKLWTRAIHQLHPGQTLEQMTPVEPGLPRYIVPSGMNQVGKVLAQGLEVWVNRRVIALNTQDKHWQLTLESTHHSATEKPLSAAAKAVVIAIPAPQAVMLLETAQTRSIPDEFRQVLRSIKYDPCITVMARYAAEYQPVFTDRHPVWRVIQFPQHPNLGWLSFDSTKRQPPTQSPVFVLQSGAAFAERHLETSDLQPVGQVLLQSAADQVYSWLSAPEWVQVHRWRYSICQNPLREPCLTSLNPLPIVGIGDWCRDDYPIEAALVSGHAAADWLVDFS
ncbi:MAG: NAD(P)/FAD-dependent oxidoreductase [Microcoleaceae cyanobacterium]